MYIYIYIYIYIYTYIYKCRNSRFGKSNKTWKNQWKSG